MWLQSEKKRRDTDLLKILNEIKELDQEPSGEELDKLTFNKEQIEREVEIINRYFEKDKSVLEVGCGSGYSTERLLKIFTDYELEGIHLSSLKILKEIGIKIFDEKTLKLFSSSGAKVDFNNKITIQSQSSNPP